LPAIDRGDRPLAAVLPDIPGIGLADTYVNACVDPRDYLDQRVLMIGKGNSAFETAENLVETTAVIHVAGPRAGRFAWRTHYVGHLRAVNNNRQPTKGSRQTPRKSRKT
jgi:thioredoxin reductase